MKDTLLLSIYSNKDLILANAFGLIHDLRQYEYLKHKIETHGEDQRILIELFKVSNRLNEGTDLAALEVQSVIDFINCSNLKLRKYKSILSEANGQTQNRLSNAAIMVGAATTVLTAGILITNDESLIGSTIFDWLAVISGVTTGYLALKSTRVDKKVQLIADKNIIRAIWTQDNSENLFPPSTWHMLNQTIRLDQTEITLREIVVNEWESSQNLLADAKHKAFLSVLLADQGIYNEDMIDLRLEMMEALEVGIDQINRALYLFNAKRH
jgi:hypothetical protein